MEEERERGCGVLPPSARRRLADVLAFVLGPERAGGAQRATRQGWGRRWRRRRTGRNINIV